MKITHIQATPVNARTKRSNAWSGGAGSAFSRSIVEIETDAGLRGIGEAPRGDTAEIINRHFARRLVGLDVLEWNTARRLCLPKHRDWGLIGSPVECMAFAGIDMALWDLLGKQAKLPLFRLLGGDVRDKAPFVAYAYTVATGGGTSEKQVPGIIAEVAKRSVAETGAELFELKVGRNSVPCEIDSVLAVRDAIGPSVGIALDANMGYTMRQARQLLAGLKSARLAGFEEPVPTLAAMERLCAEFNIPISTHCTNFEVLTHYPLIEGIVGDFHHEGGIAETLTLATVCRTHNRQFWLHTYQELGISWAARCHFGMACAEAMRPAQALINWVEDDLVLGEPWHVRDGGVRPPETPGLGVELDLDAFGRAAEAYRKEGERAYLTAR